MSGVICGICYDSTNEPRHPKCDRPNCPGNVTFTPFLHIMPKANSCQHDFTLWVDDEDGSGGSLVCRKCNMSARAHTMAMSP